MEALARQMESLGFDPIIVAPSNTGVDESYEHQGIRVRRFRSSAYSKHSLPELYGAGDPVAAQAFGEILDKERPDLVHMHAFTRAVSILLVREAKRRGLPILFTYHTPTVSCLRGSLMLWGKNVCDGVLNTRRCCGCSLEARGLPKWASVFLSCVPRVLARLVEAKNLTGGVWTALRMRKLVEAQHEAFKRLMQEVDGIVAVTEWVRTLLIRNAIPPGKIMLSRHGLMTSRTLEDRRIEATQTPLRVVFLGRADKVKGADTLIRALQTAPKLPIELHLYGIIQGHADKHYWADIKQLAGEDRRISFLPSVSHDKIVPLLRNYHFLAVPSRWLETGPLVVLEAFAAGTPVIGSNLGGIGELVRHEHNGLLVESEDVHSWADVLRRCAQDRALLLKLRGGVMSPRIMAKVAQEMDELYRRHLAAC